MLLNLDPTLVYPYDTRLNPRPAPTTGIFDSPTATVCINRKWVGHLIGVLDRLLWTDAWTGTEAEQELAITQIRLLMASLINIGECGVTFELRQNPTNLCLLEQSLDGGATWTTAMDYSTCLPVPDYTEVNNFSETVNQQIIDNTTLYDGTPQSVYPDAVYDGTPTQANIDRDLALCASLKQVVDMACEITIEWKSQQGILLGGLAFITGAIVHVLLVAGVIVTGGSGYPLAVAISGYVVGAVTALLTDYSIDVLSDQNARQLVACCMLDALEGQTLNKTNFVNSLDNCNFTFGSNEAQIAGLIEVILDEDGDDSFYAQFLAFNAELYQSAQVGALPDCPCETEWEHVFDFTVADGGWSILTWGDGWITGKGWQSQDNINAQEIGYLELFFADTLFTYLEFEHWTDGSQVNFGSGGDTATASKFGFNGVWGGIYVLINNNTPVTRTTVAYDNSVGIMADTVRLTMNPFLANPNKWYYKTVTLRGRGVNPFV